VIPAQIERAIERTDERYVADFAALCDRASTELGAVYGGQLAAKDQALAAKDGTIAELRRRAEAELSRRRETDRSADALHQRRIDRERQNQAGMGEQIREACGRGWGAGGGGRVR
jgi:predicted aminopeptidase